MRKLLIFIILFFAWGLPELSAQDPFFSRQHDGSLYLNPAFTGTTETRRIFLSYRNHYPSLGSSYVTQLVSYDQYVELLQGGIGFSLMHDVQLNGTIRLLSSDAIYSYSLIVGPSLTISAALKASFSYRYTRTAHLHFTDGVDPSGRGYQLTPDNFLDDSKIYPDFGVGFLGISRFAYAGVAVDHLNKPNMSFSKVRRIPVPWKLTGHGGLIIPVMDRRFRLEDLRLNPNLVLMYQGGYSQFSYGLDVWASDLFAGFMIRQNLPVNLGSAMVAAGYSGDFFRLAYSHDFNTLGSFRQVRNSGAHEVSLCLKIPYSRLQRIKNKAIKFPIF